MASLSLPRVLHLRKTSLEIERENFEKAQQLALQKAINIHETPVKPKHVRSAIIGTFEAQGAKTFWAIAERLPTLEDRIIAWKLCHVVHKVLREGHPLCLVDSQRHKGDLEKIGEYWRHLRDGYGKMIRLYTTLLLTKLEFHRRNPRFPGNLGVTPEELESIAGDDVDNYFDICIEMFDYLDNILDLQIAVFGSLNMARSNSMTNAGQCRLAPLIDCVQDAFKLYDYCVKILFKLHYALPPDILTGHRDRFNKIFKSLREFYNNTMNLQYFKDLISIPSLPRSPPNFLVQSDFHTYVTQEVIVPQEPPHEDEPLIEGTLIDTTDTNDDNSSQINNSLFCENVRQQLVFEKEQLQGHCRDLSIQIRDLVKGHEEKIKQMERQIHSLEIDLANKDSELIVERQTKEDVMNQSFVAAQTEQKVKDERFEKLRTAYGKFREEHIQVLREKGDLDKKLRSANQKVEDYEKKNVETEAQLSEVMQKLVITEEQLQKTELNDSQELENLKHDKELFNMEKEILTKQIEDRVKEYNGIKETLNTTLQEKADLVSANTELSKKLVDSEEQVNKLKVDNEFLISQLVKKAIEGNEDILKHAIHEIDNPALAALTCSPDYLRNLTLSCIKYLESASSVSDDSYSTVIVTSNTIAHQLASYVVQGRATCNISPDITFAEKMEDTCKDLGNIGLKLLQCFKEKKDKQQAFQESIQKLNEISQLSDTISASLTGVQKESLADMLDSEMVEMSKAIEEATAKMQDMLNKSKAADKGVKLEVNSKILDSCTNLMMYVRILVQKAQLLQAEIVAQGKGTASEKEFYKRNHQWTDGFISAAKAVAASAKFLLTAADKVVTQNGKFELLMAAAQEQAASTAQLVVASRVKADRKSENLQQLTIASKNVTSATGTVVATTKACRELVDEAEELDTSSLTLHQVKKSEIEVQVRVLELEKELEQERFHLAALRKQHYQLAGEG